MKKRKAKTRYHKLDISLISLCPRGMNCIPVVKKSQETPEDVEEGEIGLDIQTVVKEAGDFDKNGELDALVYVPEFPDAEGCVASAAVIKEAAETFAKNGMDIDIRHDEKPVGKERALVYQSYLIQKGDSRFEGLKDTEGNEVPTEGAWGVTIKLYDEELKKAYKEEGWNGVSMFGRAMGETLAKSDDDDGDTRNMLKKILDFVSLKKSAEQRQKQTPTHTNGSEDEMTKEEMAELTKMVATAVAKAIKPEAPEAQPVVEDVVKEFDPTDLKAVKAKLHEMKLAKMADGYDMDNPDDLEAYLEEMETMKAQEVGSKQKQRIARQTARKELSNDALCADALEAIADYK